MAYARPLWDRFGVGFLDQDRLTWQQFATFVHAADQLAQAEQREANRRG